jgi:TP901 family phage tail tape measure protein
MTTRTVSVKLIAVNDAFDRAYKASGRNARELQQEVAKGAKNNKADFDKVGRGAIGMGVALLGGFTMAASANMKFEKSLSGVKAVSQSTAGEMDKLRAAALKAGADTVFSASQAADAEAELVKAGVSVSDVLGGALLGSMNLAAAGQLELADAATISAQAMNIFKLRGSDVSHVADVLASGANKSAADVKQLGDALRMGGLSAAQAGIGLEETVGVLAAFHDNALVGSDAGTSFKQMIASLIPVTDRAKNAMDEINLQAYDAQGNFIGLEAVAGQLKAGLGPLSEEERNNALQTIFGNDAKRAAAVLYEQGAEGVRDYTAAMNDNGAAARMAATQMDNLAGDLEQLKGSLQTNLIQAGGAANGTLRGMTQAATATANAYGGLNPTVQGGVTAFAGIAGAAALAGGAFLIAAPRIVETRAALGTLHTQMPRTTSAMTKMAGAAGKAGAAMAILGTAAAVLGPNQGDLARFGAELEAGFGTDSATKIAKLTAEYKKLRAYSKEGFETGPIFWNDFGQGYSDAADKADFLEERLKQLKSELKVSGIEARKAAGATDRFGNAVDEAGNILDDATGEVEKYADALDRLNGVNISAAQSALDLRKSKQEMNKATRTGGRVTDDEAESLLSFAAEANNAAAAIEEQTGSAAKGNAVMRASRTAFINAAVAAGHTRAQAKKLADQFFAMPKAVSTHVGVSGIGTVSAQVSALNRQLDRLGRGAHVSISSGGQRFGTGITRADGGWIPGSGGSRADNVPIWASSGEFVVNAASASSNRALLEAINSGAHFAGGGMVGGAPSHAARAGLTVAPVYNIEAGVDGDRLIRALRSHTKELAAMVGRETGRQADLIGRTH